MQGKLLLKRKEIIEIWQTQKEEFLNSYCCPNCRDIMSEDEENYFCDSETCGYAGKKYKKSEVHENDK